MENTEFSLELDVTEVSTEQGYVANVQVAVANSSTIDLIGRYTYYLPFLIKEKYV